MFRIRGKPPTEFDGAACQGASAGRLRRGAVTLWTVLFMPVLLVLFFVVVEGVNLWLARVELENALESSALAAVKHWAESGSGPAPGWTDGAGRRPAVLLRQLDQR